MSLFAQLARADFSNEISDASRPVAEGVPEVALVRLQALLNNNLPEAEWRAVVEKLAEAQIVWFCWQISGYANYPGQNFGVHRPWPACIDGVKPCRFTSNWPTMNGRHFAARRYLERLKCCVHWEDAMKR